MAIREGRWDCSNCLTRAIKGRLKNCPKCGDPRNPTLTPEEKPYLPDDAEVVTDAATLALANAGPDWNCGHCGEANRGDRKRCANCKQPRDGDDLSNSTTRYVSGKSAQGVSLDDAEAETRARADVLVPDELEQAQRVISGQADKPRRSRRFTRPGSALRRQGEIAERAEDYQTVLDTKERLRQDGPLAVLWDRYNMAILATGASVVVIGLVVVLISSFYGGSVKTEPIQLTVQDLSWSRQLEIEAFRTLTEEDWDMPSDGRELDHFRAIHHYDKVLDHYKTETYTEDKTVEDGDEDYVCGTETVDNGNGFFEKKDKICSRTRYKTVTETKTRRVAVYRDDPVYSTKYRYQVDRWVTDHWESTSGHIGELEPRPNWPKPVIDGNYRIGDGRQASYRVSLVSAAGKEYTYSRGYGDWQELRKGQAITAHITRKGKLRSIDWP